MKHTTRTLTAALAVAGGLTAAVAGSSPARANCCAGFQRYSNNEQSGYRGLEETAEQREARLADQRIRREARRLARAEARAAREAARAEARQAEAARAAAPTVVASND